MFAQWDELGRERVTNASLRYPLNDEEQTSDGDGRVQHFQGGAICWSPETGPIVVRDLPWAPSKPVLFRHRLDRQGSAQRWLVLERSFDDLGLVNAKDKSTSLYIPSGWTITIFDKPRYRGDRRRLQGPFFVNRLHSLERNGGNWNDAIVSVHVDARSPAAEQAYRNEPPHGELVVRWVGVVSNGEGPRGVHGPVGNLHVLIYEEDQDEADLGRRKNCPKAMRHVVLPGPTNGEWDDGNQMSFDDAPLALFRWRSTDDAVSVFVYESDPDGLFTGREHDPIFSARVRRSETANGSRRYTGATPALHRRYAGPKRLRPRQTQWR